MLISIREAGAAGDGVRDDTDIIGKAIDECRRNGGGEIYFPAGVYRTMPFELCSNLSIRLGAGAVISFSNDYESFPLRKVRWEGVESYGYMPLVYGWECENVSITGQGTLDGNGAFWWAEISRRLKQLPYTPSTETDRSLASLNAGYETAGSGGGGRETLLLRPPIIQFLHCKNVTLRDFKAVNSPFWTVHLVYCEDAVVDGIRIHNPPKARNGDGLSIDSSRFVRVTNCDIDAGDDCLTLKSGIDADGRRVGRPTEYVTISNCTFRRGHGAVVCGSEIAGGVRHVTVSNCTFVDTDRGIRIKARRGRGGYVKDVRFSNITMNNVLCPLVINAFYHCGAPKDSPALDRRPMPIDEATPIFKRLHLSNVTALNCRSALAFIDGLPEAPVDDLSLHEILFTTGLDLNGNPRQAAMSKWCESSIGAGALIRNVRNAVVRDITLVNQFGPSLRLEETENVLVDGITLDTCDRDEIAVFAPANDDVELSRVRAKERNKRIVITAKKRLFQDKAP